MKFLALLNAVDRNHCPDEVLRSIEAVFSASGNDYRIIRFHSKYESISAIADGQRDGFDTLLMGGGDGTIHHLFNLSIGKGFRYGVIPLGTVSALARSLNIPANPAEACRVALAGKTLKMDIGRAANRYFTCFGSVGLDASVVHTIETTSKVRWKHAAFVMQGLRRLARLDEIAPIEAELFPSGEIIKGYSLLFSNLPIYAGFRLFASKADDGEMEMLIFKKNKARHYLYGVCKMLFNKNCGMGNERLFFRGVAERLIVRSAGSLFMQLDGEPIPTEPAQDIVFEVIPKAAEFLVP